MNLNQQYSKYFSCATIWASNVCFTGVLVNVLNNDIYIEKSISCTAAVNFLTAKGFKLWEKTFQHIINQLLNFEILEFWALHLPQLTRNCSFTIDAVITILELPNDEVCVSEQYPPPEVHKITENILSLGYLWDYVFPWKMHTLNIAKE